jgi:hypothetical protein
VNSQVGPGVSRQGAGTVVIQYEPLIGSKQKNRACLLTKTFHSSAVAGAHFQQAALYGNFSKVQHSSGNHEIEFV